MGACFLYGNGGSNRYRVSEVYGGQNPPNTGVKDYDIFLRTNVAIISGEITTNVGGLPTWDSADGVFLVTLGAGAFDDTKAGMYIVWDTQKFHNVSGFPGNAYIHENGKWRRCEGYVFHSNKWVQFSSAWDGTLFYNGNQYEFVTGGWTLSKFSLKDGAFDTGLTSETSGNDVMACTVNKLDVGQSNTLHIQCYSNFKNSGGRGNARFGICNTNGLSYDNFAAYRDIDTGSNTLTEYSIDISSVSGTYYVKFYASVAYQLGWLKIAKMWLT